jgi:ATP-dependent DNA helicase RecG
MPRVCANSCAACSTRSPAADLPETLPDSLLDVYRLTSRWEALQKIHFPENQRELDAATRRLKFEELFFLQLRLLQIRRRRKDATKGFVFDKIGDCFNDFFTTKNCPSNSRAPKNG